MATKPRILIVYQYIALYRFPLFRELAQSEEFDFCFAAGTTGVGETPRFAAARELEAAAFEWIPLKNHWLPGSLLWQSGLLKSVRDNEVSAVIFLGDLHYLSTWAGLLLCRLLDKPAYLWTIGMHRPESGIKLKIRKVFFSLARHIFVYGDYARGLMRESGVPDTDMTTIGNSLDFDAQLSLYHLITEGAVSSTGDSAHFNLISIGRLTSRRKLNLLIEAIARLIGEGYRLKARIIGAGPELEVLQDLAQRLGVADRIEFLGAIYDEEVVARYAYAADLCVVPGVIGLAAVHAHGYGLPVITCGNKEIQAPEAEIIIPRETGDFCEWDNLDSLTDTLRRWLDADHDRDKVRNACLAAVESRWTPVRQRALFEDILRR